MKLIVCGGRTGGHLIPGLAIYEEAVRRGFETRYVMSSFDLNYPVASRVAERHRLLIDLRHISRKLSWKTPFYLFKILVAFLKFLSVMKKFRPDTVIVTGGYISNPVSLAAVFLRVPLFIAEQNSVAGVTNRFYSRFAKRVFTSFPDTLRIPSAKAILTGNPTVHREIHKRTKAGEYFGLAKYGKIIGITGGSQGARLLNDLFLTLLPELKKRRIGVVWSVGTVDYDRLEKSGQARLIRREYPNIRLKKFVSRMDLFLSACDMVISRAGATTIAELIRYGMPSVLVPIRNSPDNHQFRNAEFLSRNGCALILEENRLDRKTLISAVEKILKETPGFRKKLSSLRKRHYRSIPEQIILDEVERSMAY